MYNWFTQRVDLWGAPKSVKPYQWVSPLVRCPLTKLDMILPSQLGGPIPDKVPFEKVPWKSIRMGGEQGASCNISEARTEGVGDVALPVRIKCEAFGVTASASGAFDDCDAASAAPAPAPGPSKGLSTSTGPTMPLITRLYVENVINYPWPHGLVFDEGDRKQRRILQYVRVPYYSYIGISSALYVISIY